MCRLKMIAVYFLLIHFNVKENFQLNLSLISHAKNDLILYFLLNMFFFQQNWFEIVRDQIRIGGLRQCFGTSSTEILHYFTNHL